MANLAISTKRVQLARSSVEDLQPDPSELLDGELAVNTFYSSMGLFCKDSDGVVRQIGAIVYDHLLDQQLFDVTDTWTKPDGCYAVHVLCVGAGAGGEAGTNSGGGSGGAAGSTVRLWLPAAQLGATEDVTVGEGGTGGTFQAGLIELASAGGPSSFGPVDDEWVFAVGGGHDSSRRDVWTGVAASNSFFGSGGAAGSAGYVGGVGSGGGGGGATSTTSAGSDGGQGMRQAWTSTMGIATGGGSVGGTGTSGGAGAAGVLIGNGRWWGHGGGGGGGKTTSGAGGAGGDGIRGSGGGGGGRGSSSTTGGSGGMGGNGFVVVTAFCWQERAAS